MSECRKETPMTCAMVAPSTLGAGDLPIIPFLLDVSRMAAIEPKFLSLSTTRLTLQLAFGWVWRHR